MLFFLFFFFLLGQRVLTGERVVEIFVFWTLFLLIIPSNCIVHVEGPIINRWKINIVTL